MKSGNVLLGVLAGVAAGALMGILLAPDKGANTRKRLLGAGEDYADALKEKFDEVVGSITKKHENVKDTAEDVAAKGHSKFNEVKREIKNSVV